MLTLNTDGFVDLLHELFIDQHAYHGHDDSKTEKIQRRAQHHAEGKRRQRRGGHARPEGLYLHEKRSEVLRANRFGQLDDEDIVGIDGLARIVERLAELGKVLGDMFSAHRLQRFGHRFAIGDAEFLVQHILVLLKRLQRFLFFLPSFFSLPLCSQGVQPLFYLQFFSLSLFNTLLCQVCFSSSRYNSSLVCIDFITGILCIAPKYRLRCLTSFFR